MAKYLRKKEKERKDLKVSEEKINRRVTKNMGLLKWVRIALLGYCRRQTSARSNYGSIPTSFFRVMKPTSKVLGFRPICRMTVVILYIVYNTRHTVFVATWMAFKYFGAPNIFVTGAVTSRMDSPVQLWRAAPDAYDKNGLPAFLDSSSLPILFSGYFPLLRL